jgi:hypothetical protein
MPAIFWLNPMLKEKKINMRKRNLDMMLNYLLVKWSYAVYQTNMCFCNKTRIGAVKKSKNRNKLIEHY